MSKVNRSRDQPANQLAASWTNWPNPEFSKQLIAQMLQPGVAIGDAIVATKAAIKDVTFVSELRRCDAEPLVGQQDRQSRGAVKRSEIERCPTCRA